MRACAYTECDSRKEPKLRCKRCKRASYCSARCQKLDWKAGHKRKCWAPEDGGGGGGGGGEAAVGGGTAGSRTNRGTGKVPYVEVDLHAKHPNPDARFVVTMSNDGGSNFAGELGVGTTKKVGQLFTIKVQVP